MRISYCNAFNDVSNSSAEEVELLCESPKADEFLKRKIMDSVIKTFHTTTRVTFADDCNEYYSSNLCKEDTKDLWYTEEDYEQFRTVLRTTTRNIAAKESEIQRRDPNAYLNVMERVFHDCCNGTFHQQKQHEQGKIFVSICNDKDTIDDDNRENNSDNRSKLVEWERASRISRVGMERMLLESLKNDKRSRRRALFSTVSQIQGDLFYSVENDQSRLVLAKAAQFVTLPSRLFAQQLAFVQFHIRDSQF